MMYMITLTEPLLVVACPIDHAMFPYDVLVLVVDEVFPYGVAVLHIC